MGSSQTRARTCVPCIGRQILNHCATREAQFIHFLNNPEGKYLAPFHTWLNRSKEKLRESRSYNESGNLDSNPSLIKAQPIVLFPLCPLFLCNLKLKGGELMFQMFLKTQMFFKAYRLWNMSEGNLWLPPLVEYLIFFFFNFLNQRSKLILPLHSIMMNRNKTRWALRGLRESLVFLFFHYPNFFQGQTEAQRESGLSRVSVNFSGRTRTWTPKLLTLGSLCPLPTSIFQHYSSYADTWTFKKHSLTVQYVLLGMCIDR